MNFLLTTSSKKEFRPRACKANRKDKFGVNFDATIRMEGGVRVQFWDKIVGEVVIYTPQSINCRELMIQFEAFLTIPTYKKYKGSVAGKRQSILRGFTPGPDGYQQSPLRELLFGEQTSNRKLLRTERFPFGFALSLPGHVCLPNPIEIDSKGACLVYRLALYMQSPCGTHVELAEKLLDFSGYNNLAYIAMAALPVLSEKTLQHTVKETEWASATFSLESRGFLRGESIPFVLSVKSRWKGPMELSLLLRSKVTLGKFLLMSKPKPHFEKKMSVMESVLEFMWKDTFEVPLDANVSYSDHHMLEINNLLQYKVKFVGMDKLNENIPVYIGTTRGPLTRPTGRGGSRSMLVRAFSDVGGSPSPSPRRRTDSNHPFSGEGERMRSNSVEVADFRGSMLSLPPSYSQLSSRAPSMETLPPNYDELWPPGEINERWEILEGGKPPPYVVEEEDDIDSEQN